jgi:hypothetical protein
MKIKVAILCLLFSAFTVKATPILNVDYFQQEFPYDWNFELKIKPLGTGNGPVDLLIDGIAFPNGRLIATGLLPEDPTVMNGIFAPGTHTTEMIYQGVTYHGDSYTVLAPEGVRAFHPLPDSGSTFSILSAALGTLAFVRRKMTA